MEKKDISIHSEQPIQEMIPDEENKKKKGIPLALILIIVLASTGVVIFSNKFIDTLSKSALEQYEDAKKAAYEDEKNKAYNEQYQKYYTLTEEEYHVKNRGYISIEEVKEIGLLEVLQVNDIEFVIRNKTENNEKITAWLQVAGTGIYVVNLEGAEYIVDNERKHVLVRVPSPELTNIQIDYNNTQKLLFKNDLLNENYSFGEELAKNMTTEGEMLVKKEFISSQDYLDKAEQAAIKTITYLVKQFNMNDEDLMVEVEFY